MKDFRRLLKYLKPHWLSFALAILAMVVGALFEVATLGLLAPIIGVFSGKQSQLFQDSSFLSYFDLQNYLPAGDWQSQGLTIAGLLITFTILGGIADYFSSYLMAKIGQSGILQLRQELYNHLLQQSAVFFEKHRTNYLVSRIVNNCAAIEWAVSVNLRDVLRETITLILFISYAFYLNWRLMLGALLIAPVIAILTGKFSKSLRKRTDEAFEGNKRLTDTVQETLANQTIVKAYHAEVREKERFRKAAQFIATANLRGGKIVSLSPPIITTIGIISVSILLLAGLREINVGNMDAGQFAVFLAALLKIYEPMRKISRQHNEFAKALAAASDVWEILDENEVLPEKPNAVGLSPIEKSIEVKNVSFHYANDEKLILDSVSLEISKGEMVALVGESGGGKSSLIKLIQRLYDPTKGAILWDGIDLRDAKIESLKKQIALVTQETILFNESVRYNISYGKPDATDEGIIEAAKIAFADEFIKALPNGYDTIVGERGTFLSGGQRQRIAIARAVLVNAPVLILDEATSALDAESERLVQKALTNLMKNRTSVVIAHRLSTIRRADKIIVMERGRIVQTGTHEQLLAESGTYKKLYELQFADEDFVLSETK